MKTPYSSANQQFSDMAHEAAQELIYPKIFETTKDRLTFVSTSLATSDKNRILDGEMATDRIVNVTVNTLRRPLQFTIQERFRRVQYSRFQDVTITEWNNRSGQPSELYKLNSGVFVYGYFDDTRKTFDDWVAFNTVGFLYVMASGKCTVQKRRNGRSSQDFYTVPFDFLQQNGLILSRKVHKNSSNDIPEWARGYQTTLF